MSTYLDLRLSGKRQLLTENALQEKIFLWMPVLAVVKPRLFRFYVMNCRLQNGSCIWPTLSGQGDTRFCATAFAQKSSGLQAPNFGAWQGGGLRRADVRGLTITPPAAKRRYLRRVFPHSLRVCLIKKKI